MNLNFMNKKPAPTQSEQSIPPVHQNPVLEIGKEHTFKDPRTGEFVYQRAIPAEHRAKIMQAMQDNSQCANVCIQLSRQKVGIDKAILDNDNKINETEKKINDTVQTLRDELKIDRRWLLNPQLMILERRDAPNA